MRFRGITFVNFKSIFWVLLRKLLHLTVARHFGKDGGGRNRLYEPISTNNSALRVGQIRKSPGVDENILNAGDLINRATHGKKICCAKTKLNDLLNARDPNGPRRGFGHNGLIQPLALFFCGEFAVAKVPDPRIKRKHSGACDKRTGKRSAASLVNANNGPISLDYELTFNQKCWGF
jgi:hypothetical protein